MPAQGQYRPNSLPTQLRAWFNTHPGLHRPVDIAAEFGHEKVWRVANECGRLYRQGQLRRVRVTVEGRKQPVTYYEAATPRRTRARRSSSQEDHHQEDDPQADPD